MKLWTRILALVLCLMLSGVLAACGNTPAGPGTETQAPETGEPASSGETGHETKPETDPGTVELNDWLNEDGTPKYKVVWPDGSRLGTISAKLRQALSEVSGVKYEIMTDWVDRGTEPPADNYEILVGRTNRKDEDELVGDLTPGMTRIVATEKKLMFLGYDEASVTAGVTWFINTYLTGENKLTYPSGTIYEKAPDLSIHLVQPVYDCPDLIVADVDMSGANSEYYGIDPTGEKDCTNAIQSAINSVAGKGGGTVYLPAGKYLVTSKISIPPYVTLRGDWQDPDKGTEYGTVILAVPKKDGESLFEIRGSAGVNGLTVFYPEQSLTNPKPYGFTFYTTGAGDAYMLASVTRCTVINGYQGLGACVNEGNAHEQFSVDTFKGTFIRTAAEVYNQADVGTWKLVTVNPKYWAECPLTNSKPTVSDIAAYTRKNTVGLILGDLEWTEFAGLYVSDCKYGIQIVDGKRIQFAGSISDALIQNTDIALKIDNMDARWGMTLTNSKLSGSSKSIENNSSGAVKMSNVTLSGTTTKASKADIINEGTNVLESFRLPYEKTYEKPAANLFLFEGTNNGSKDVSAALQSMLDEAGKTGGIVYLPAGVYRLDSAIDVPAGVELRGASASPNRDTGSTAGGTVLMAKCLVGENYGPDSKALITLGPKAGLSGVRIVFPDNGPKVDSSEILTALRTAYAVRGTGEGVYLLNCCICAAGYGVDFSGCDNHYIKKLSSLCYFNTMLLGGKNGVVEGCLQNGTVLTRKNSNMSSFVSSRWLNDEGQIWAVLFDPITRAYNQYIVLTEGEGEVVFNTFIYGPNSFVTNEGMEDAVIVSIGADNIGGTLIVSKSGSMDILGAMRYNGDSIDYQGGTLGVFTRLSINDKKETPFNR